MRRRSFRLGWILYQSDPQLAVGCARRQKRLPEKRSGSGSGLKKSWPGSCACCSGRTVGGSASVSDIGVEDSQGFPAPQEAEKAAREKKLAEEKLARACWCVITGFLVRWIGGSGILEQVERVLHLFLDFDCCRPECWGISGLVMSRLWFAEVRFPPLTVYTVPTGEASEFSARLDSLPVGSSACGWLCQEAEEAAREEKRKRKRAEEKLARELCVLFRSDCWRFSQCFRHWS